MKRKNYVLIILCIMVALTSIAILKTFLSSKTVASPVVSSKTPTTENFSDLLQFKSKYMGNNSNFINLNNNLPLSNFKKTFSFDTNSLTAEISYDTSVKSLNEKNLRQALAFNSACNFILIDNLQALKLDFTDASFTVTRVELNKFYGLDISTLKNSDEFYKVIQAKLNDSDYLKQFTSVININ